MGRTVVIGAGAVGLTCAYELQRRGEDVVVVDQGTPGSGCSHANAGWIVPSLCGPLPAPGRTIREAVKMMMYRDSPLYIDPLALPQTLGWLLKFRSHSNQREYDAGLRAVAELGKDTFTLLESIHDDGVDFEYHRDGLLFVFMHDEYAELTRSEYEPLVPYGYSVPELLDGRQLLETEPLLSDAVSSGLFVSREQHVRPETYCHGLAACISSRGGKIEANTEVTGGEARNGRLKTLHTVSGALEGDRFILSAGAWSGLLARKLGFRIPVQAGKGYSLTYENPPQSIKTPLYLGDVKTGVCPFDTCLRVAGTMEFSGINSRMRKARLEAIKRNANRYLREPLPEEAQQEWVGMRPMTPDGLPIIGPAPTLGNCYIATAHVMLGVTLAPSTARVVADLVLDGRTDRDLRPFSPSRFH
jgi:D-amino-acid dehydrogenase